MPQFRNAANGRQSSIRKTKVEESNKPPRCSLFVDGEILKLLILQHKWYNSNSATTHNVFIFYCQVALPYICIFTLRNVTDDVTVTLYCDQHFPSITYNRNVKKSRNRHHCDRNQLPNRLICDLTPSSIHDLKRCDLPLTSGSTLTLTLTKRK